MDEMVRTSGVEARRESTGQKRGCAKRASIHNTQIAMQGSTKKRSRAIFLELHRARNGRVCRKPGTRRSNRSDACAKRLDRSSFVNCRKEWLRDVDYDHFDVFRYQVFRKRSSDPELAQRLPAFVLSFARVLPRPSPPRSSAFSFAVGDVNSGCSGEK